MRWQAVFWGGLGVSDRFLTFLQHSFRRAQKAMLEQRLICQMPFLFGFCGGSKANGDGIPLAMCLGRGSSKQAMCSAQGLRKSLATLMANEGKSPDFSLLLADAVGRELRKAYQEAPSGARAVARQITARAFGVQERAFENQALVSLIIANPNMSDGVGVFNAATHGDQKAPAGVTLQLIKDDLSAARLGMRKHKKVGGLLRGDGLQDQHGRRDLHQESRPFPPCQYRVCGVVQHKAVRSLSRLTAG